MSADRVQVNYRVLNTLCKFIRRCSNINNENNYLVRLEPEFISTADTYISVDPFCNLKIYLVYPRIYVELEYDYHIQSYYMTQENYKSLLSWINNMYFEREFNITSHILSLLKKLFDIDSTTTKGAR